jgi:3-oxoadipate enol-lactonase/4-carboxymuconolactone decarboxylase
MPFVTRAGVRLYWRADGHPSRPALLLLNSLGTDHAMWDGLVPSLARSHRVLRMDTRGHGASDAPEGDYSIPMLAADALAVLDAADVAAADVAGVSMGGATALHLAAHSPSRVRRVVACNTSAEMPPDPWVQRAALVREAGLATIADSIMERFFSAPFRAANPPALDTARSTFLALPAQGYAACCMALAQLDLFAALPSITAPLLVVNGTMDAATPPEAHGDRIAAAVAGARTASLPAGHLSPIEMPDALARLILSFLADAPDLAAAREGLFDAGQAVRRSVLGDAWVDQALAKRGGFSGEFQELITRFAWSEVWGRPGLDHRTRRIIVLSITVALGRWEEFRLHCRAALEQGGMPADELKEVLMQAAIYAGVPAANTAFKIAEEILAGQG